MPLTPQAQLISNLTYNGEVINQILNSGGTIIFNKDNIIVASEVSEAQYLELSKSIYIDKIDVLPLKRYANQGIEYTESSVSTNNSQ